MVGESHDLLVDRVKMSVHTNSLFIDHMTLSQSCMTDHMTLSQNHMTDHMTLTPLQLPM